MDELSKRLPELERLPFAQQMPVKRLIAKYRKESIRSHWRLDGSGPEDPPDSDDDLAPHHRGPYSRARLDLEHGG